MTNTTTVAICFDNDVVQLINEEAKKRKLSRSAFVSRICAEWFSTHKYIEQSMPEILKGVEDIKKSLEQYGISVPEQNASAVLDTGVSEPASDKTI